MNHVRISDALRDLIFEPLLPLDDVLDKYYAPDYVHRSEGKALGRKAFAELVAQMRGTVTGGSVVVVNELRVGDTYAERHVYDLTTADGARRRREVYVFGTFARDGRFQELSETGISLTEPRSRTCHA